MLKLITTNFIIKIFHTYVIEFVAWIPAITKKKVIKRFVCYAIDVVLYTFIDI